MDMSPPKQKPHRSVQEVRTPRDFVMAVQHRFGVIGLDAACTYANCVADFIPTLLNVSKVELLAYEQSKAKKRIEMTKICEIKRKHSFLHRAPRIGAPSPSIVCRMQGELLHDSTDNAAIGRRVGL